MNKYEVIIFDLDGTLLDTTRGIAQSVNETLVTNGYESMFEEDLTKFIGPPMQESFEKYLGLNKQDAWVLSNNFRDIYIEKYLFDANIYYGVEQLLVALKKLGCFIGIATSKRIDYTIEILKHFGIYNQFDFVYGSDMEGKYKKSDIISFALTNYSQFGKSKFVMIGDTIYDEIGAKNNDIDFIAVTYGFGYKQDDFTESNAGVAFTPIEILEKVK